MGTIAVGFGNRVPRGGSSAFNLRTPLREEHVGRPRLIPWPDLALGQVSKQYAHRRVVGIERRIIQGSDTLVRRLVTVSQGRGVLNPV
jgi:hypothetical protein